MDLTCNIKLTRLGLKHALKTYFLVSFGFAISKALITSFETVASLSVAFSALSRASLKKIEGKRLLVIQNCINLLDDNIKIF